MGTLETGTQHLRPQRHLAVGCLALLRPRQWYKNLLVFAGLLFSGGLLAPDLIVRSVAGFGVFCLLSGGVYAFNDVRDAPADRLHPAKAHRPVASGRVPAPVGVGVGVAAVGAGAAWGWTLGSGFFLVCAAFLGLQGLYQTVFKHHVFLDLFSISGTLLLRAVAGVVLLGVLLSPWLVLCTFFLALFLGLGKRRDELRVVGADAEAHRRSLGDYSEPLLDRSLSVVMPALVVSYSLYAFFHPDPWMMLTVPFVLYGVFRYLFLATEQGLGGSPEQVFADRPSVVNMALWVAAVVVVLYYAEPLRLAGSALVP